MTDLKYRVLLADEIAAVEQTMLPQDERMPPPVRQALASLIGRGGKRLRPILVLMANEEILGQREELQRLLAKQAGGEALSAHLRGRPGARDPRRRGD